MNPLAAVRRYFAGPVRPGPSYAPARPVGAAELRASLAGSLPTYAVGKPVYPEQDIPAAIDAFKTAATIFACVTYRANAVATAKVRAYRGQGRERRPDDAHPLRQLMSRPNPQASEAEFLYAVQLMADVTGFCVVEKVYSQAGTLLELWPLRSDLLKPVPRANAAPDWRYYTGERARPWRDLPAERAIVLTAGTSPTLPITGFGPMQVAIRHAALYGALLDYVVGFFQHGGLPPYGLVPRELGEGEEYDTTDTATMREAWRQVLESGVPPIMWSIKEVVRLGFDFDELAFDDLHALTDTKVCSVFGVPPILVHTQAGLDAGTYSNFAQARRSFYEDTVTALWARFDGALTRGLLDADDFADRGVELEFDVDDVPALQDDKGPEEVRVVEQWKSRLLMLDEARQRLGYPRVAEARDALGFAAGEADEGASFFAALPALDLGEPDAADDEEAEEAPDADDTDAERAIRVALARGRSVRRIAAAPARRAAVGETNRALIEAVAERSAPWVAAFFRAQATRVAAAYRAAARAAVPAGGNGRRAVALPGLDWAAEDDELRAVLDRLYRLAGQTAYRAVNAQLGASLSFDLANPDVARVLDELLFRPVLAGINEETQRRIAAIVTEGELAGKGVDQIADDLRAAVSGMGRARAETIARSESAVSYNTASALGYRETGLVDRAGLHDNPAHDTDPQPPTMTTCADRDGRVVPLAEVGAYVDSMHPRCIMAVSPVLIGEEA